MSPQKTLIFSKRYTDDSQLLYKAAIKKGWSIWRFEKTIPSWIMNSQVAFYCESTYAEYVCEQLNLSLLKPRNNLLANLPFEFVQRKIRLVEYKDYIPDNVPRFIKPADYKYFAAGIYYPNQKIPGFEFCDNRDPLLISDVVNFEDEYRFFILNNKAVTGTAYVLDKKFVGENIEYFNISKDVLSFVNDVINTLKNDTPASYVIDIGKLDNGKLAVIEFNPSWCSGIYNADPNLVLDCVAAAVVKENLS